MNKGTTLYQSTVGKGATITAIESYLDEKYTGDIAFLQPHLEVINNTKATPKEVWTATSAIIEKFPDVTDSHNDIRVAYMAKDKEKMNAARATFVSAFIPVLQDTHARLKKLHA